MFCGSQNLVLLGPEAEPVSARGISPAARCTLEVRILQTLRGHASQVLDFVQLHEGLETITTLSPHGFSNIEVKNLTHFPKLLRNVLVYLQ